MNNGRKQSRPITFLPMGMNCLGDVSFLRPEPVCGCKVNKNNLGKLPPPMLIVVNEGHYIMPA